jgi:uroporphyrin-III C-methyltransferase
MKRKVYLVGAGPGDPELLTLKSLTLLRSADVVLHDDLVSPEILALASAALLYNVGKRCGTKSVSQEQINFLLVSLACSGLKVVRLKGGDPLIFGRGGEELQALRAAGIEVEVVPGITAAVAAGAATQVPLTHRQLSSAVVFLTNHQADAGSGDDWRPLASLKATLVIYMPGSNYSAISRKLRDSGFSPETPCAVISRASTAQQQAHWAELSSLPSVPHLPAPTLLIVGEVARYAETSKRAVAANQALAWMDEILLQESEQVEEHAS